MPPDPIFHKSDDGTWRPSELARGPFEGLQGGALAALMCGEIEARTTGFVASVTTHFLRPTPMAPLAVTVRPVRKGRRVSVWDAELRVADAIVALQRATVIAQAHDDTLPTPPPRSTTPAQFPAETRRAPHGRPWLFDVMEARREAGGCAWFRLLAPVSALGGETARVLPAADWAHGLTPPLGAIQRPPVAIPNPDLTVHLIRPPRGAWIGVEPACAWSIDSVGAGWAELSDVEGLIGRVAMSIAVARLPAPVTN